jgi:hypothetical protein
LPRSRWLLKKMQTSHRSDSDAYMNVTTRFLFGVKVEGKCNLFDVAAAYKSTLGINKGGG